MSIEGFEVPLLEGDNDWPAVMKAIDDIGYHGGAGHGGRTHRELALVVDQEDPVKSHRLPGFNSQEFDFQRIARANTILFASCF